MDLTVDEFIDGLFSDEAYETPSDSVKAEDVEMKLPKWFDKKKYDQGRRFFLDFYFIMSVTFLSGLIGVFAIPTILNVLVASRRSTSLYSAYKRYISTVLHVIAWFSDELKPGSTSWRSLYAVRTGHIHATRASKLKGLGVVSQRDMAFTIFGFIGYIILKADRLSVTQLKDGDWEGMNHLARVVGYMLGLQDRYNICRRTAKETRQVCQVILERVYTPCLTNVPEHFEHMTRKMLQGLSLAIPPLETDILIYLTKYISDVPGYIINEEERWVLREKIEKHLEESSAGDGVESTALIQKSAVQGLPKNVKQTLYLHDFTSLTSAPAYKNLPPVAKWKLSLLNIILAVYTTRVGRVFFNYYFRFLMFIAVYIPLIPMWKFGIQNGFVDIFKEVPIDNMKPKPNSEFYKPLPPAPWYKVTWDILW